jgi:hypothetical protein
MITRGDEAVLGEWLRANMRFLDGLVLLDGSDPSDAGAAGPAPSAVGSEQGEAGAAGSEQSDAGTAGSEPKVAAGAAEATSRTAPAPAQTTATRRVLDRYLAECGGRALDIVYLHEQDEGPRSIWRLLPKSDQTLRAAAHARARQAFRTAESRAWILLCHPDEFPYDDPRAVAAGAQRVGHDHSFWFALHVLPHTSERAAWERGERAPNVQARWRHFHHDRGGQGHPFLEGRLFRDGPQVSSASRARAESPAQT